MNIIAEHHTLNLTEFSYGSLQHLNYPQSLPININFTQHLVAPIGNVVLLEVFGVGFSENECRGGGGLEVGLFIVLKIMFPNFLFSWNGETIRKIYFHRSIWQF